MTPPYRNQYGDTKRERHIGRSLHLILEQTDLGSVRQLAEGTGVLEHLDVGLGHLRAGGADLLDGDKVLALSSLHQIDGGVFAQARNGHEGWQNLIVLDEEFRGVALVEVDGGEFEAAQVEFVDDLQGGQQVLVLGGCIVVVVDGVDVGLGL